MCESSKLFDVETYTYVLWLDTVQSSCTIAVSTASGVDDAPRRFPSTWAENEETEAERQNK